MDRSQRRRAAREANRRAREYYDEHTGPAAEHDVRQQLSGRRGLAQLTLAAMAAGWQVDRTYWMNRGGQSSYHVRLDRPDGRILTIEMALPRGTSRLVLATHTGPGQQGAHIHDVTTLGRYIAPDAPIPSPN